MSLVDLGPAAPAAAQLDRRASLPLRSAVSAWLGREGVLVAVGSAFSALLLTQLGQLIRTDGWLGLVAGRLIATSGLPSHDTLTLWAHGRTWIDQQWLSHLLLYGLDQAGGLRLVTLVHVLLMTTVFGGAMLVARRRGAAPRAVAIVAVVGLPLIALASLQVRPEAFAYPLFVVLVALLTRRRRLGWRSAAAVVALLALWANLHGSVVLAAGLVILHSAVAVTTDVRARRISAQPFVVAASSVGAVLASPYALALPHYYAATLLRPGFRHYLAVWQPTTLSIVSLPLFLLAGWLLWQFGRAGSAYSAFEKLVALILLVGALTAVRNWVWFALFAVAILPVGIRSASVRERAAAPWNRRLALAAAAGVGALAAAGLAHPASWYGSQDARRAADAAAAVVRRNPNARIYSTVAAADALLWAHPELAGHIAFDARYELLDTATLRRLVLFRVAAIGLRAKLASYDLLVLSRLADKGVLDAVRGLGRRVRYLYSGSDLVVVSLRERPRARPLAQRRRERAMRTPAIAASAAPAAAT